MVDPQDRADLLARNHFRDQSRGPGGVVPLHRRMVWICGSSSARLPRSDVSAWMLGSGGGWCSCRAWSVASLGDGQVPRLGDPLLDDYLDMVAARARPNTVLATAFDLKVFFSVVGKEPAEIGEADVLAFIAAQRQPRRGATVVRIEDGEAGLSARTIKRRLASVTGLFEYLIIRGVVAKNPVPHGLSTRSPNRGGRGVPLIRTPRTLPRVIDPDEADALLAALRTHRDRAMVAGDAVGRAAPLRGVGSAARRRPARRARLFIVEGKGGISGSCRSHRGSSRPWPPIWSWNGRERRRRIGCSSCSKAGAADDRSARPGWTRSSPERADAAGSNT